MWDINDVLDDRQNFIAVISSYYSKDDLDIFAEYVRSHLTRSGGLIYLCSSHMIDRCVSFIKNNLGSKYKKYIDMNKLIFINRDEYMKKDAIDFAPLMENLKKAVGRIRNVERDKEIYVYITVDRYWNRVDVDEIDGIYEMFRSIDETGKVKFMVRYFIEEIATDRVYAMLKNHRMFFLDGVDSYEVFTWDDLFHKALTSLCQNKTIDYKQNKLIMRNEFLENLAEIFGGIVHDMNNLLVSIIGYAQYSMEIDQIDEIHKCLQVINKLALDGKKITEKVKREVKGNEKNKKEVYKFNYIINNCIDMVKHKFRSSADKPKDVKLIAELNSQKYIYADEYDLRHSIINIILNGIDAMEDGGVLTIRTYDEDDMVVLEISDTGCGIEKDMIDKIFKPYFTTKGSKGTGLGLSIAKRVFEEHDGTIAVESEIGKGTKFTIVFLSAEYVENIESIEEYDLVKSNY